MLKKLIDYWKKWPKFLDRHMEYTKYVDNVFYHGDSRRVVIGDMGLARQVEGCYYNSTFGMLFVIVHCA